MILVNGQAWGCVSATDRGLAYGDGAFRTLRMRQGKPLQWPRHYAKLAADCARLLIACPAETLFWQDMMRIAAHNREGVIKLVVTRGEGQRGYALPTSATPTRIVMHALAPQYPVQYYQEGVRVRICDLRLAHQPALAGIKHLNRLEQVLARAEWQDADIAEGLLLDQQNDLVSGTMSNVFAISGGALVTPDLAGCGIAGVTRARILAMAPSLGLTVAIGRLTLDELLDADEVILCNSLIGVWRVRELAHKRWRTGSVSDILHRLLEQEND